MVNKLAEIEPRSTGDTVVTNPDTGEDFFRPEQLRDVFIFTNDLDAYAEVSIEATHSNDEDFQNSLIAEEGIPVLPTKTREKAYTGSNELLKLIIDTPTAPTSGSLTIWREKDNTPVMLDSSQLNTFEELNEGRTYTLDFQESLIDTATITAGVNVPESSDVSVFVKQFGISVGGDALITTEIDHGSYTEGTALTSLNGKPELQIERPLEANLSKNPTTSSPQEGMTGFLPGGVGGGASPGGRYAQADYELSPGQDMTIQIQNDSGAENRYGFSLELIETVVR